MKRSIIDLLKESMHPREFYGQFFDLSRFRRVRNMVACPFHNEKKPSCQIDLDTGNFRCFGCGEFGDMIDFYRKIKDIPTVSAAVKQLAVEYGIDESVAGDYDKMPADWPATTTETHERKGCDIEAYAEKKGIPVDFLANLGIETVEYGKAPAIFIPYRDKDGKEVAARYRIGLGNDSNFR